MQLKTQQLINITTTISTLSISTCISYMLRRNPIVFASALMLLSHEYGHYFAGIAKDKKPNHPVFIPLGILTVGATRVLGTNDSIVAISGPIAGLMFGTILVLLLWLLGCSGMIIPIALMTIFEVLWGVIGDGRKFIKIRYSTNHNN